MPEPVPTLIHFRTPGKELGDAVCGESYGGRSSDPGQITCFACRNSIEFKRAQRDADPIQRLSAVFENHPLMKELERQGQVPQFEHDCEACLFLGRLHDQRRYDLYYCQGGGEPNVLARWSSNGPDYTSGLGLAKFEPVLAVALARAIHHSLFPANKLHLI
jgi:hypothetical protein